MAKVVHLSHASVALFTSKCEASSGETLKDETEVLSVFLHGGRVNENIVEICSGEWQPTTDLVHQPLERCRGSSKPKRHSAKLKKSHTRSWAKGSVVAVCCVYWQLPHCKSRVENTCDPAS